MCESLHYVVRYWNHFYCPLCMSAPAATKKPVHHTFGTGMPIGKAIGTPIWASLALEGAHH